VLPAAGVLLLVAAAAASADWLVVEDPAVILEAGRARGAAPSWEHPFGTDPLGRDLLGRMLRGARVSLLLAGGSALLASGVGLVVGTASALAGGAVDRVLMRVVDVLLAMPRVLLLLVAGGLWGHPGLSGLVLLLALTGWMATSRVIRATVRGLLVRDHVLAARALGAPRWHLLRHHLLPAVWPLLAVWSAGAMAQGLLLETGLSFLGLGVRPPVASWGTVLHEVSDLVGPGRWLALGPGLLLVITVMAIQRVGDGVQRALLAPWPSR
jgi:peptide/nickel transport system permease protein